MERTVEIPADQWTRFFDDFSKAHEGWIVTVEVVGRAIGSQEAASGLPLVGLGADTKDGERRVEVMVGRHRGSHATRIIEKPRRVWLEQSDRPGYDAIAIAGDDGTKTIVRFQHVDPKRVDRQLPPG
jgi:hypothetical protein